MKNLNTSNGIIAIIFYLIYKVLFDISLALSKLSLTTISNKYIYGILILILIIISFTISYFIYKKFNNKNLSLFNFYVFGIIIYVILFILNKFIGDYTGDYVSNKVSMELSEYIEYTRMGYTIWLGFNALLLIYFGVSYKKKDNGSD